MKSWQMQQAKAHLSEVIKEAIKGTPQEITLRGEAIAVVISIEEYNKLVKKKLPFIQFIRTSPLAEVEINVSRNTSLTRKIDL